MRLSLGTKGIVLDGIETEFLGWLSKVTSGSVGQTEHSLIKSHSDVDSGWYEVSGAGSRPCGLSCEPQEQQSPGHLVIPALGCKDRNSVGTRAVFPNYPGWDHRAPGRG